MKTALITGILGQDGYYLAKHLLESGYEVYGTARRTAPEKARITEILPPERIIFAEMRNESQLACAFTRVWPSEVYNLAAQNFVPSSWTAAWETLNVNCGGLARLLDVIYKLKPDTKVFEACSAAIFGNEGGACNEETRMEPSSPYGVSKVASLHMAGLYRSKGMFVATCILFNHESPLRAPGTMSRKIVDNLARFLEGKPETLRLGNLHAARDYGFAGDYVRAMHAALQAREPDDYVIGTGEAHSVAEFLDVALESAGINAQQFSSDWLVRDEAFCRPGEPDSVYTDASKARKVLAWEPRTSFAEMVDLMVQDAVRAERAYA